jgi:hypothetical protein
LIILRIIVISFLLVFAESFSILLNFFFNDIAEFRSGILSILSLYEKIIWI